MMSFELLLDAATDARIRAEWTALLDADLPSQARHTGASNAPHITLLAARAVDATLRPTTPPRHASEPTGSGPKTESAPQLGLPARIHLGGLVVFGGPPRGLVLARLVAVSGALLALHASVHSRASGIDGLSEQTAAGQWTPHITLASRLTPAQLAAAIEVLAAHAAAAAPSTGGSAIAPAPADAPAFAVELRHWNGDTKTTTAVEAPLR